MAVVKATNRKYEEFFQVDDCDLPNLAGHKWRVWQGYVITDVGNTTISLHRYLLNAPIGMKVDHINGDTRDNRRSNLRLCTDAENARNQKLSVKNTCGYKGVSKMDSGKYRAQIKINGRKIHLGSFDSPKEAYAKYCKAARELHRDFANPG